jgi:hypothetical protein
MGWGDPPLGCSQRIQLHAHDTKILRARPSPCGAVLEDNIGESDAANRAEAPNRIPDWQYGVAVPIRRQAESSFSFLFEGQMDCRQGRLSLLKSPTGQGIGLLTKRAADAS